MDTYYDINNKILNVYVEYYKNQRLKASDLLKNTNDIIRKKANSRAHLNISFDFISKIKYASMHFIKFFAVAVLGIDHAFVSFDSYKYLKEKSMSDLDAKVEKVLRSDPKIAATLRFSNSYISFCDAFLNVLNDAKKTMSNNEEISQKFYDTLVSIPSNTNHFSRLFTSLRSIGVSTSILMKLNDNFINVNVPSTGNFVNKIEEILSSVSNEKGRSR